MTQENHFRKKLNHRHIFFIAIGAAIGTGLFLGSATAIHQTGPSVILAYIISGMAIFFTMRAMGEVALQVPHLHTFGSYASHFISPFAGFITGWSYILQMTFVCLADITAFATYMKFWYPDVSPWIWTLALAAIICAINLTAVKIYGELEFLFSIVKVLAIFVMIIGGIILLSIGFHSTTRNFSEIHNIFDFSYWFPHDFTGFIQALPIVIYSFGGIEVIGITAAESENPEKSLPKAINAIPFRIVFFYVMTLSILLALYPWQQIGLNGSPFVTICEALGIHSAANVLNFIVATAAASTINSDIYGSSRMLYSLAREGHALKKLDKLSNRGIPNYAIFVMLSVLVSGVVFNYLHHDKLFLIMADIAALTSIVGWFMIVLSQIFMRWKIGTEQRKSLKFPVPLWPIGSFATLGFMLFTVVIMSYYNTLSFACTFILMLLLTIIFYALKHLDKTGKLVYKFYH